MSLYTDILDKGIKDYAAAEVAKAETANRATIDT